MKLQGVVTHYDPKIGFGKIAGDDKLPYTFNKKADKELRMGSKVNFEVSNAFQFHRVATNIKLNESPSKETKE